MFTCTNHDEARLFADFDSYCDHAGVCYPVDYDRARYEIEEAR